MTTIAQIHQNASIWDRKFKHQVSHLQDAINHSGITMSYTRSYPSGKMIMIPLIRHDYTFKWLELDYQNEPLFSYQNKMKLPSNLPYSLLKSYIQNPNHYLETYSENTLGHTNRDMLCHIKQNMDGSITNLAISHKKNYAPFIMDKSQLLDRFLTYFDNEFMQNQKLLEIYTVEDTLKPVELNIDHLLTAEYKLSAIENSCFLAIYYGHYDSKRIAKYLSRSHRTIEDILSRIKDKLECENKYDLVIKIKSEHNHARYLMNQMLFRDCQKIT